MRDHISLLCDVGELNSALAGSADVETFLQRLVGIVAAHLEADVCSIYLRDPGSGQLVLRATKGLASSAVGRVRLSEGEGLTGTCLKELRPILVHHASGHPAFRHFPEIGEEPFESFLAVPVVRALEKVGVLTVQRREKKGFGSDDARALKAVAAQLAGTLENARALMGLRPGARPEAVSEVEGMRVLRGAAVSPGVASGKVKIVDRGARPLERIAREVPGGLTVGDLASAVEATAKQLEDLQRNLAEKVPEAASLIFDAQLLMIRDGGFTGGMTRLIEEGAGCAESVVAMVGRYSERLAASPLAYLREKTHDIEDVAHRLLAVLAGKGGADGKAEGDGGGGGLVAFARTLYPSDVVLLAAEKVGGLLVTAGGSASHVSILSRALGIPLVICEDPSLMETREGTPVVLDGWSGNVYVRPTAEVLARFGKIAAAPGLPAGEAEPAGPARTLDGARIRLLANINLLVEVAAAKRLGAEGIGLYRTEFPFMIRTSFPSEEEQFLVYRRLVESMEGKRVIFRTLDAGGEKALSFFNHPHEQNPELGLRSIRLSLRHRELFSEQVRAILRAGEGLADLGIMFPMISSVEEFREARGVVAEAAERLREEGVPFNPEPRIGVMVEIPAAVEIAGELAAEAEFISIGTNDLVQYLLAADRSNSQVAAYYRAHHPAVLRALSRVAVAAGERGVELSVCGEMAHQGEYLPFLIGIGVGAFSVDPHFLPMLREAVASLSAGDARAAAAALLEEGTVEGVERLLRPPRNS